MNIFSLSFTTEVSPLRAVPYRRPIDKKLSGNYFRLDNLELILTITQLEGNNAEHCSVTKVIASSWISIRESYTESISHGPSLPWYYSDSAQRTTSPKPVNWATKNTCRQSLRTIVCTYFYCVEALKKGNIGMELSKRFGNYRKLVSTAVLDVVCFEFRNTIVHCRKLQIKANSHARRSSRRVWDTIILWIVKLDIRISCSVA